MMSCSCALQVNVGLAKLKPETQMTDYTWNIQIRKEMATQTASLNILFAGNFDLNSICQSLSLFKLLKFNLWYSAVLR
jgi:hypothetical protein